MQAQKQKAITLIALVITIVILLILAGITIGTLGGENGLLAKTKQAKIEQMKAEAKENITLAIMKIQMDEAEQGKEATLQSLHDKLPSTDTRIGVENYNTGEIELKGTYNAGEKQFKYTIDEFFNVTIGDEVTPKPETVTFSGVTWTSGTAEVTINTKTSNIIEYQINGTEDGKWITGATGTTIVTGLNQNDVLYARLTDGSSTTEPEKLEIKDIIKPEEFNITVSDITYSSLKATGSTIDNQTGVKDYTYVAESSTGNKIEFPNVTAASYDITGLEQDTEYTVYMLAYDNAGNARKSSTQTITTKKLEITTTEPIIATTTTATTSVEDNSQTKGDTLYINFSATLEGTTCTIVNKDDSKSLPYEITSNGIYTFIATGTYDGNTITKEIEVTVNKYQSAQDLVKYDAGEWTQEEIEVLNSSKLYALNESHTKNNIFKLNDDSGLNFTFGGFTYAKDKSGNDNADASLSGVITSRNQSVSPESEWGTPLYEGWQILTKETKEDSNGDVIKNADGSDRIYVKKLVHAGIPENFVFCWGKSYDGYRAEYLLSNGERKTSYNTLSDGTTINPRSWDIYKDKSLDAQGYINNVHLMDYDEALAITGSTSSTTATGVRKTGSYYWLATAPNTGSCVSLQKVDKNGGMSFTNGAYSWGIRPVVELNDGIYISSGSGTEQDPYILGKE